MSVNSPDHTLKSQYHAQVTADLESNSQEQERITTEVAALKEQLTALELDHALLTNMQQALATSEAGTGSSSSGAARTAGAAAPSVPRPRNVKKPARTAAAAGTSQKSSRKASEKTSEKAPAKTSAKTSSKSSTTHASRNGAPTLRDLVSDQLAQQKEPRSASEVTTALTQAHPQRKVGATVVRNTLEALVAKGQALRSKQQNSVFYSATSATKSNTSDSAAASAPATA
ncbi:hypothetical protein [Streptomyces sp. NBC_00344]|uniref:hypothetical protein n=1 Tax=Streptomyces sp. NBC_00344 TaxID=2975720 RepID=UPI002E1BA91A